MSEYAAEMEERHFSINGECFQDCTYCNDITYEEMSESNELPF